MRIIRSTAYVTMPWRNGGGSTTEIAVWPAGADTASFEWRLSMARVEQAGPFSQFAGIDRTIALLEGGGLNLSIEGHAEVSLEAGLAPYSFPGDVPAHATLAGDPVLDLNLMSRRADWRHALVRSDVMGAATLRRLGDVLLVLVRGSSLRLPAFDSIVEDGDTLFCDVADPPETAAETSGRARMFLAHLWRR